MLELVPGHLFDLICSLLSHRTRGALVCASRTLQVLVAPYSYFRPTLLEEAHIQRTVAEMCRVEGLGYAMPMVIDVNAGSLEVIAVAMAAHLSKYGVHHTFHVGSTHWGAVENVRKRMKQYLRKVAAGDWELRYSNTSEHIRLAHWLNTRIVIEMVTTSYIVEEYDPLDEAHVNEPQVDYTEFEVTVQMDEPSNSSNVEKYLQLNQAPPNAWTSINTRFEPDYNQQVENVFDADLTTREPWDVVFIRDHFGTAMNVLRTILRYYPRHPKGKMKIHVLATKPYAMLTKVAHWGRDRALLWGGQEAGIDLNEFLMREGQYGYHLRQQLATTGTITYTYQHGRLKEPLAQRSFVQPTDANGGPITNITLLDDYCVYLHNKYGQQARLLIKRVQNSWMLVCNYNGHCTTKRIPRHVTLETLIVEFRYRFFALTGNHWDDFPHKFVPIDGLYMPIKREKKNRDTSPRRRKRRAAKLK